MTSKECVSQIEDYLELLSDDGRLEVLELAAHLYKGEQNLKASQSEQQPTTRTITNHYGANRGSEFERAYI